LVLRFSSTLNEGRTNESFGFSDIRITAICNGHCQVKPVKPKNSTNNRKTIYDQCRRQRCIYSGWITNVERSRKKTSKC
jgi:hypothetical protein